jgi:hypothetical protein
MGRWVATASVACVPQGEVEVVRSRPSPKATPPVSILDVISAGLHVAPVLIGDGVRLFQRPGGAQVKLTPVSSSMADETTVRRIALATADGR